MQTVDIGTASTQSSINSAKKDSETERTNENIEDGVTDDTSKETTGKEGDNSTSQNKVEERGVEQSANLHRESCLFRIYGELFELGYIQ